MNDIRAYRTLVHFMAYHPSGAINKPVKNSIAANIRSFLGISFRTVEKGHTGITHQIIILVRKTKNVLRQMTC